MKTRNLHSVFTLLASLGLLSPLSAEPAANQSTALEVRSEDEWEPAEKSPNIRRFKLKLSLEAVYDDNIGNLRGDARSEFLSGDFADDRFLLDSIDDTVLEPELILTYSSSPENGKANAFGGGLSVVRPESNDILAYQRYFVFYTKDLTDVRPEIRRLELEAEDLRPAAFQLRRKFLTVNRSRLKLGYYRIDNRYSGQLRDIESGDRRSVYYDADVFEIKHRQRLNRGQRNRAQLLLRYLREERDYTADFNERDSSTDRFLIGLNLARLLKKNYLLLEGYYEFMDLSSDTSLTGTVGAREGDILQTDLASERDLFGLRLGVNWYRSVGGTPLRRANRARIGAIWAAKDFTTDNALDLTHFGREDDGLYYAFDYTHAIRNSFGIYFWVKYYDQDTARLIGDRRTTSNFEEVLYGIGFTFQTGRRLRDRTGHRSGPPYDRVATSRPEDLRTPAAEPVAATKGEAPAEAPQIAAEDGRPEAGDKTELDAEHQVAAALPGIDRGGQPGRPADAAPAARAESRESGAAGARPVQVAESAQPCLNLRTEGDLDAPRLRCLEPGSRAVLVSETGDWSLIRFADGSGGWAASRYIVSAK